MIIRIFLVAFGLVLLTPGACSLTFMVAYIPLFLTSPKGGWPSIAILTGYWAVGFLIAWGGGYLIRAGLRPRPPESQK